MRPACVSRKQGLLALAFGAAKDGRLFGKELGKELGKENQEDLTRSFDGTGFMSILLKTY